MIPEENKLALINGENLNYHSNLYFYCKYFNRKYGYLSDSLKQYLTHFSTNKEYYNLITITYVGNDIGTIFITNNPKRDPIINSNSFYDLDRKYQDDILKYCEWIRSKDAKLFMKKLLKLQAFL